MPSVVAAVGALCGGVCGVRFGCVRFGALGEVAVVAAMMAVYGACVLML